MSREADQQIADILGRHGEPFAGNVWRVQGTAVIYHKALERIAASAGIRFDKPEILRAERDEAVILVTGHRDDRVEWSIGEAVINVNYRVSGKQAAYVYAMAEKRGKDRVILKLIELHGLVYSEEEADDFRRGQPAPVKSAEIGEPDEPLSDDLTDACAVLRQSLAEARTVDAVTALMLEQETQQLLNDLPEAHRATMREAGKARMIALGWQPRPRDRRAS